MRTFQIDDSGHHLHQLSNTDKDSCSSIDQLERSVMYGLSYVEAPGRATNCELIVRIGLLLQLLLDNGSGSGSLPTDPSHENSLRVDPTSPGLSLVTALLM
jgi:hypothetical protein